MLKNNGKMVIGKNILLCIAVICLMFTAVCSVENSFAVELNDTADEIGIGSDDIGLENSQENEILEANADDGDVLSVEREVSGRTFGDIQKVINGANPGDTIKLDGQYYSTGSTISVNKKLNIIGSSSTVLDGRNLNRILYIKSDAAGTQVKNIKFINGNHENGGAILVAPKNVLVDNCVMENNRCTKGGGAICSSYDLDLAANLKVSNCKFIGNMGYRDNFEDYSCAGALAAFGKGTVISNCLFDSNWVKAKVGCWGGAIQVGLDEPGSNVKVIDCVFKNNSAISINENSHGGAGCVRLGTEYIGCVFMDNFADEGGALSFHSSGNVVNCTFMDNSATMYGGAISTGYLYDYMKFGVYNCDFSGNTAPIGGAIQAKGMNIDIVDSNFKDNRVTEYGGAINIEAEDVNVKNSLFRSNIANVDGGAIYVIGTNTKIENSEFISNQAVPDVKKLDDGLGGAIYVDSSLATIKDNKFRFNTARNGSAIYYDESGDRLTLENNELFQNQAWVYALPIYARDIFYGDGEKITVTLFGGNNIGDYDNLAVSNAIYNAGSNQNILVDDEYPVNGATNTGILYQDSREYNINVLLTVQHEDGTMVYNEMAPTNYLGQIIVDLNNLKPGKYTVNARHYEDTYYKAITNATTFVVNPKVDNEVTKTVSKDIINFEDIVIWTITVKNHGPNDSTNVTLSDVLPDGLIWVNDTSNGRYNRNTGKLTIDDLKVNGVFSFEITTVINKTGEIVNGVNVTSNEFDANYTNNFANKTIFVNPAADLAVVKSVSNSNSNYHDEIVWTIVITNNGPDTAHDVIMKDILPKSLVFIDSDGDYDEKTGIWNIESLIRGETVRLNIRCHVNATGLFENLVCVNATEFDFDPTNNNDSEIIYVNPASDLSIIKTVNASVVNFNDLVKWKLAIKNNGPDDAVNVRVIDLLPEGFSYVDSIMTKGDYVDDVFTIDNIKVGEEVVIEIITLVENTGNHVNAANVESDNYDPDLTNNADDENIFVNPAADLSVTKSVSDSNPQFNDIITWTIEIINNGPDVAHNITVKDLLPSSLIWIEDDSEGDYNPKTGILFIDELDVEETYILNIDCTVNATGSIENIVSVNGSEYDYNLTNNEDNETIDVEKSADVAVVKMVNNSSPNYNDLVKWTVVISNNGPDKATEIEVVDVLPEGLTFVNYTATKGFYDTNHWIMCCLENGEVQTLEIVCRVNKTGKIINIASIHADEYDYDESNNNDSESIDVPLAVDLQVMIEANNTNPIFGESVKWMISVKNNGPDDATGVFLKDILPDELIFSDYESSKGIYESDIWNIGSLNVGDTVYLNITTISDALGVIPNHVEASAREYDWNMANNHAKDEIDVRPIADLSIVKLVNKESPKYGQNVKWILIVTNNGPNVAHNVVVRDILPEQLKFVSSNGDYSRGIWKIGSLEVGETKSLEIICKVISTGSIVNNAKVWADELDLDMSNNQANRSIDVAPASDLTITKIASKYSYRVGDVIEYRIEVANNGPDTARNIKISEILDDLLKVKSFKTTIGKFNRFTNVWTIDSLGYGESARLIIRVIATGSGIIKNTVTVTSDNYDYDKSNNNDYAVVNVTEKEDNGLPNTSNNGHFVKKPLSNLELHPTANPLAVLLLSLLVSVIFSGFGILKKR